MFSFTPKIISLIYLFKTPRFVKILCLSVVIYIILYVLSSQQIYGSYQNIIQQISKYSPFIIILILCFDIYKNYVIHTPIESIGVEEKVELPNLNINLLTDDEENSSENHVHERKITTKKTMVSNKNNDNIH